MVHSHGTSGGSSRSAEADEQRSPFMKPFVFTTFRHGKVLVVSDLEEMPSSFHTEYAIVTSRALPVTVYSTSTVFETSCETPARTAAHPPATKRTSTSSTHGHLRLFFLGGAPYGGEAPYGGWLHPCGWRCCAPCPHCCCDGSGRGGCPGWVRS